MKTYQKALCILLAAVLAVCLLSGCAKYTPTGAVPNSVYDLFTLSGTTIYSNLFTSADTFDNIREKLSLSEDGYQVVKEESEARFDTYLITEPLTFTETGDEIWRQKLAIYTYRDNNYFYYEEYLADFHTHTFAEQVEITNKIFDAYAQKYRLLSVTTENGEISETDDYRYACYNYFESVLGIEAKAETDADGNRYVSLSIALIPQISSDAFRESVWIL